MTTQPAECDASGMTVAACKASDLCDCFPDGGLHPEAFTVCGTVKGTPPRAERQMDDATAERLLTILGSSLDVQITNAEYLQSRGYANREALAMLHRARQIREQRTEGGA